MNKKNILVFLGAMLCCFLWGSAFAAIKVGYQLWNIPAADSWMQIFFAGIRFFLAGLLVIIFASLINRRLLLPRVDEYGKIMLLSLFQTIGQYICFYLGLAHTTGVNSAVVNSLTTFAAILIASLLFRMEKLTPRKIIGCILGFTGVILINVTAGGISINLLGDGLIMLSCVCYGVSSSLIKRYSKEHDTVVFSGYQFLFGGFMMTLVSGVRCILRPEGLKISAGKDAGSILILLYLALVSSVAYTLWGILLRNNDVSRISIYGFMTPIFGVLTSAVFLSEASRLGWKHLIALILVAAGIVVVNVVPQEDDGAGKAEVDNMNYQRP